MTKPKLTAPTGANFNCSGPLNQSKPPKVTAKPQAFAKVVFDQPEVTPIRNSAMVGTYQGLELKPFSARAGSQDAFKLPSRSFDKEVV